MRDEIRLMLREKFSRGDRANLLKAHTVKTISLDQ